MGGAKAVIVHARADFAKGEYRWVASVMKEVVFAEPDNAEARGLMADALEQLGYQAEAAPWRNEYLVGAQELRQGLPKLAGPTTLTADTLKAVSTELFFDFLGVRLDAARAEGKHIVLNWTFTDLGETHVLNLENSALTHRIGPASAAADASLTLTRAALDAVVLKQLSFADAVTSGRITIAGDAAKPAELLGLLDTFTPSFAIVTPREAR
jgi:alkyl sulfatase BDS1-like metallo-beta-lactamase superfamily hydrolase